MNGETPTDASPAETGPGQAGNSRKSGARPLGQIKEDFRNTIEEIKKKFGLLLELRDRQIKDLTEKLARAERERPKPRLLIVDDAKSTGQIVNRYLEGQRVEVVQVAGDQARKRLGSEDYGAIMLEAASIIEPRVDGLGLCRELCEQGRGGSVIVMSSRPGDRIKGRVEQAGAMFLRKPFQRDQLVRLMRSAVPAVG